MGLVLSKSQAKKILKESKNNTISAERFKKIIAPRSTKDIKRVTSKEYREILLSTQGNRSDYSFTFEIEKIKENKEYVFILKGKHLSVNSINGLSLKNRIRYKNSIKKAVYGSLHKYKHIVPENPFSSVILEPTVYLKRYRDDDNNYGTLKIIRDMIVNIGFVENDSREYLEQKSANEVLSREWKIEIKLKHRCE